VNGWTRASEAKGEVAERLTQKLDSAVIDCTLVVRDLVSLNRDGILRPDWWGEVGDSPVETVARHEPFQVFDGMGRNHGRSSASNERFSGRATRALGETGHTVDDDYVDTQTFDEATTGGLAKNIKSTDEQSSCVRRFDGLKLLEEIRRILNSPDYAVRAFAQVMDPLIHNRAPGCHNDRLAARRCIGGDVYESLREPESSRRLNKDGCRPRC
jgi:hypothetical protein